MRNFMGSRLFILSVCMSSAAMLMSCGGGDSSSTTNTTNTTSTVTGGTATSTTSTTTTSLVGQLDSLQTCGLTNFQQEIIERVNQVRGTSRSCGSTLYNATTALQWNDRLFNSSAAHSNDMASNNYFSHTSQDGRTLSQRVDAAGYQWSAIAENIAAGQTSAEQVINGWLDSPGHCANMMSPSYSEFAVACVKNDASTYKTYWTMNLGHS